jgi:hypothetical protein
MQAEPLRFDTKIAVVLRDDLPTWQKLNVTAFVVSGLAGTVDGLIGEPYVDGSGHIYLPMFRQPVLVFTGRAAQLRAAYERARGRDLRFAIYTEGLFNTGNDRDNRAAVRAVPSEALNLVGMAFWEDKKTVDKVLKGLSLHP